MRDILLEVHLKTARRWAVEENSPEARLLLERIAAARKEYDMCLPMEGDLWGPDWNPTGTTFRWEDTTSGLQPDDRVCLCGVQKSVCVRKAKNELKKRGFNVRVRQDLTFDC